MKHSGSFADVGYSRAVRLRKGESILYALIVAAAESFIGAVQVERSTNGVIWEPVLASDGTPLAFTGTVASPLAGAVASGTIVHSGIKPATYRIACYSIGDTSDALSWELTEVQGERVGVLLRDEYGNPLVYRRDDGTYEIPARVHVPGLQNLLSHEVVPTNGDTAVPIGLDEYETSFVTSGSGGAEDASMGDGTGVQPGTRKLLRLASLGEPGDSVALDHANIVNASGAALQAAALTAEGAYLLLEFNGAAWQEVYASAAGVTLTPAG